MQVYLAYSGDLDRHDRQSFDLIGVFQDRAQAVKAIEELIVDYPNPYVERVIKPSGNIFWEERGMDIVTVGYLECRSLQ